MPAWAVLQRRLFDEIEQAWPRFVELYCEADGRLRYTGPLESRDGVDDFYEPFFNWPAFHALGGGRRDPRGGEAPLARRHRPAHRSGHAHRRVRERVRLVPPGRVAHLLLRAVRGRPDDAGVPRACAPVRRAVPRPGEGQLRPGRQRHPRPAQRCARRARGRRRRVGVVLGQPGQHEAVRPSDPGDPRHRRVGRPRRIRPRPTSWEPRCGAARTATWR